MSLFIYIFGQFNFIILALYNTTGNFKVDKQHITAIFILRHSTLVSCIQTNQHNYKRKSTVVSI